MGKWIRDPNPTSNWAEDKRGGVDRGDLTYVCVQVFECAIVYVRVLHKGQKSVSGVIV